MASYVLTPSEQYFELLSKLNEISCNPEQMKFLRFHFHEEVGSKRRLASINSVKQLIQLLQKRDVVNENNIVAFKEIATILKRTDLLDDSSSRDKIIYNISNDSLQKNYAGHKPIYTPPDLVFLNKVNSINQHEDGKRKAYRKICDHLGEKWRDFARELKLIEGTIDELNNKGNISDKVMVILMYHEQNCDPVSWRSKLLSGLEDARRKDLKKVVEEIFDIHFIYRPYPIAAI